MTKISDLTTGPAITGTEEVPARVGGTNFKYSWSQVLTYVQATYGTSVGTFLATPNSANLRAAMTDETGTGALVFGTSPTLTTPALGVATATTINGNTFTTGTYTLTGGASKTLTFNNSLTLAGTDGTTATFPTTNATIARTDAGQTFTGTNAFGVLTATTVNGLTITPAAGTTLTIGAGATLTVSNTLTLSGTNGTTMTFPTTSATLARTDAANTFTGTQTLSGLTASSAVATDGSKNLVSVTNNGTGNNVLTTGAVLVTPTLGAATATTLAFSPTTGGIIGTATNDSANSGNVGEVADNSLALVSGVTLVSATAKTVIGPISIPAGDWEMSGIVYLNTAAGTSVTQLAASCSATTNAIDFTLGRWSWNAFAAVIPGAVTALSAIVPPTRLSLSGATNFFLTTQCAFTSTAPTASGQMHFRRLR